MNQKTFFIGIIAYGVYVAVCYFVLKTMAPKIKPVIKPPIDNTKPIVKPDPPIVKPDPPIDPDNNKPIIIPPDNSKPTAPVSGRWQDCGGGITHTVDKISGFCGQYQWLSNFQPAKVTFLGKNFLSVESAYHAAKWADDPAIVDQFVPLNAVKAYQLSNTLPAYNSIVFNAKKLDFMRDFVGQKFAVDPLKSQLKSTGQAKLEEYNWWGNKFWGMSPDGENWLGVILMETRSKL